MLDRFKLGAAIMASSRFYTEIVPSPRCWVETVTRPDGLYETMALLSPIANDVVLWQGEDWEEARIAHETGVQWALRLLLHTDPKRPAS